MKTKLLLMLSAGIVMLAACSGNHKGYESDSANTVTSIMKALDTPRLIKTGGMRFKVKNVQQVAESIDQLTQGYGGMVVHNDLQSNIVDKQDIVLPNDSLMKLTVYNSSADMIVKIPSDDIEAFMNKLNHLGVFVDERKMNVEDKTLDYVSTGLKADNRAKIARLRSRMKNTDTNAAKLLALKDDIVDKQISNLRTADSATYSTLNLTLYQNNTLIKEVTVNDDLSLYNVSFLVRLKLALSRGWFYFSELIVIVLHLWGFILSGGLVWIAVSTYKKRKLKKELKLS